jgi:hypothetical protein
MIDLAINCPLARKGVSTSGSAIDEKHVGACFSAYSIQDMVNLVSVIVLTAAAS